MELVPRFPADTDPEAKRKRHLVWAGLCAFGVLQFLLSGMQSWGVLAAVLSAAVLGLLDWLTEKPPESPYRICLDEGLLRVVNGPGVVLWTAATGHLTSADVTEERKKWGIVVSARTLVFHKDDGDSYATEAGIFDDAELHDFVAAVRRDIALASIDSRKGGR